MDANNLIDFNSPSSPIRKEPNSVAAFDKSVTSFTQNVEYKASPQSFVSGRESLFSQAILNSIDIGKESMPFDHNTNLSQSFIADSSFKVHHVNINRQSISFNALSTSFEIGRESMPFNISTLDPNDIGRPSLLVNKNLDLGRESLDLLNISGGKESLGILHHLPDLNTGLTTDLNTPSILLSDLGEDTNNTVNSLPSYMNKGFLHPNSIKESVSSISSVSSFGSLKPSFNSHTYNSSEFSKIYSVGSSSSISINKTDVLNKAFQSSQELLNKLRYSEASSVLSTSSIADFDPVPAAIRNSPVLSDFRRRILSLTTDTDLKDENKTPKKGENSSGGAIKKDIRKFWSTEKIKKSAPLKRRSFCGQLCFSEDEDDNFNDSVFIEANHIAHKIANSFTGDAGVDDDVLDSTSPPDFNDIDEPDQNEEKPPPKYDQGAVLKIVAKYFPPLPDPKNDLKFSFKIRSKPNASNSNVSNVSNNSNKDHTANVTHTSENGNENSHEQSKRSNLSRSKDAKDLLHNLSEILNNTNKSENQKSEGQSLLNTLASILTQSPEGQPSISMEDSGHSSFAMEIESDMNVPNLDKPVCYEVLDLRTTRSRSESDLASNIYKSDDLRAPLDLSGKLKTEISYTNSMSQSFNFPQTKKVPHKFNNSVQSQQSGVNRSKNSSKTSANGSVSSNDGRLSMTSRISVNRFKLKRGTSESVPKKGPMRAFIPIENIAQSKSQDQPINNPRSGKAPTPPIITPEKCQQLVPNFQNEKKTSTPIAHNSKMKPMAQSTPDKPRWSYKHRSSEVTKPSSSGLPTPGATGSSANKNSNIKRFSTGSIPKGKQNVSQTSIPSRDSNVGSVGGSKKASVSLQRRYSVTETKKTVEPSTDVEKKRSFSTSRDSGIMSALSRVRENMTKSPFYNTKLSTDSTAGGIKPLSSAINTNTRQSKSINLKPIRKLGKENKES